MSPGPLLLMLSVIPLVAGVALVIHAIRSRRRNPQGSRLGYFSKLTVSLLLIGCAGSLAYVAINMPYYQLMPVCQASLRTLGRGTKEYFAKNGVPPATLAALVDEGLATNKDIGCRFTYCERAYLYVTGLAPSDPPGWIVAFDPPGAHPNATRNVLFRDGRVSLLKESEFQTQWSQFADEFKAARGELPVIHEGAPPFPPLMNRVIR